MSAASLPGAQYASRLFRQILFPGIAGVALAITLAFFQVVRSSPAIGIELLKAWGPGFLLGIVAIAVVGGFMSQLVDMQQAGVEAQQQVAVALTRVAEKDDRERDRMVTETQYMMQKMEQAHVAMAQTHAAVTKTLAAVERIESKLGCGKDC